MTIILLMGTSCHAFAVAPLNLHPLQTSSFGVQRTSQISSTRNMVETWKRNLKSSKTASWMSNRGGSVGDGEGKTEKGFAELASALALLDEEQKNNDKKQAANRWTKLDLRETGRTTDEQKTSGESSSDNNYGTTSGAAAGPKAMDFTRLLKGSVQQSKSAYLLEPPNGATPTGLILFLGGAVLGSYPQVAYTEFLHRLSTKTNAAVIAVPYNVGLDHLDIAKHVEKMFTKAEEYIVEKVKPEWKSALLDNNVPRYAIGHSLGCKLHSLRMAALPQSASDLDGIGFLAFNNYGFGRSLGMARSFASQIFGVGGGGQAAAAAAATGFNMNALFDIVEQVTTFAGFEFVPSPTDTERIIEMRLADNPSLNDFPRKCRLFQFEDDELDCSAEFDACFNGYVSPDQFNPDANARDSTDNVCEGSTRSSSTNAAGDAESKNDTTGGTIVATHVAPMTSTIPMTRLAGTHLTPVYINVQVNDLLKNTSPEARDIATQMTDLQGVSFGSEEELNGLVDKIAEWMAKLKKK